MISTNIRSFRLASKFSVMLLSILPYFSGRDLTKCIVIFTNLYLIWWKFADDTHNAFWNANFHVLEEFYYEQNCWTREYGSHKTTEQNKHHLLIRTDLDEIHISSSATYTNSRLWYYATIRWNPHYCTPLVPGRTKNFKKSQKFQKKSKISKKSQKFQKKSKISKKVKHYKKSQKFQKKSKNFK